MTKEEKIRQDLKIVYDRLSFKTGVLSKRKQKVFKYYFVKYFRRRLKYRKEDILSEYSKFAKAFNFNKDDTYR